MCGILGICFDGRDRTDGEWMDIAWDFSNLWIHSMDRGTDAAGVYIVNRDSEIHYIKAPVTAEYLVGRDEANDDMYGYWEFCRTHLGPDTVGIIGHTRAATTGDPKDNDNNHPVVDAPIIGVHNGVIQNHRILHTKYPKCAEVDSAAIMSLLKAKAGDKPLTTGVVARSLHELKGSFAIAVADMRKPDGIFLARNHSPVSFTRNRAEGVLMFASTADILRRAISDNIKTFAMPSDTVCRISRKTVHGSLAFKPLKDAPPTKPKHVPSATLKRLGLNPKRTPVYPSTDAHQPEVDGGLRCSTCHQLYLMVYHGNVEQRCCNCNPYGGF